MKKMIFLVGLNLLWLSCQQSPSENNTDAQLIQKAQKIHLKTTTLDTHDDINVKNFTDSINYSQDTDTQVNLPKMESGALDVAWFIVYTGQDTLDEEGYAAAYANAIDKFEAFLYVTCLSFRRNNR